MPRRPRIALKPEVLGLEAREVPTVVSPLAFGGATLRAADVATQAGLSRATPAATPSGGVQVDPATLTSQGLAAARFAAKFNGPVGFGSGQFVTQSGQYLYTASGNASQFLVGRLVMRLFTPADPTSPVTGIASIRDRNVATSGTQLVLDISGDATGLDRSGRPVHLTWTVNGNSGGFYAGALGQGTLDITYSAAHRHVGSHSAHEAGSATAIFRGVVVTNGGVTDPTVFELNKRL